MTAVRVAVEGQTDVPIAERILRLVGREPFEPIEAGGKTKLDPKIPGLNRSAVRMSWLILRDLDHDAPCASALVRHLLAGEEIAPGLHLRIVVRASESWLLADDAGFADEFSVARKHLPDHPDSREDPKRDLVAACGRSRRQDIRRAMTPRPGSGREVGPEYTSRVIAFAATRWDPERASCRSPSLARTIAALRRSSPEQFPTL